MELDGKAKYYSIVSGIIALTSASFFVHYIFLIFRNGIIDNVLPGISGLIAPASILFSMILYAIYIFFFYGKKQSPLLGISAALLAVERLYSCFTCILTLIYLSSWGDNSEIKEVRASYAVCLVAAALISGLLIIVTIRYFSIKIAINIKMLPLISLVIMVIFLIIFSIAFYNVGILYNIINSLFFVPFALFSLFCPHPDDLGFAFSLSSFLKIDKEIVKPSKKFFLK